jgi:phage-related protein
MKMKERSIEFCGSSKKDLLDIPVKKREQIAYSLECLRYGLEPTLKTKAMNGLGKGVIELKIDGKPAYRCVYVVGDDAIHVLHVFVKTSDGTDKKHEVTIKKRRKDIE